MLIAAASVLAAVGIGLPGCSSEPVTIDISYSPFEPTALVWIAEDQGYFSENGLSSVFHKFDTGAQAVDAMLSGESDVAVGIGELPVVSRILEGSKVRVLASMARSENIKIVARKDRGIAEGADLKGKKVGTTRGTAAEFFLGRFLEIHGLSIQDVTLVDLKTPAEWVEAVAEGSVDAVSTAEPYATQAGERLGENAVVWSAHSGQPLYGMAVATAEWLATQPDVAKRFLRALAQAEDYAVQHPAEAQAIVQKALDLDPASMPEVWERSQFSLVLDQALIAAMEDEARWLMANGFAAETTVPDFLDYLWVAGLEDVRPEVVNIIRSSAK